MIYDKWRLTWPWRILGRACSGNVVSSKGAHVIVSKVSARHWAALGQGWSEEAFVDQLDAFTGRILTNEKPRQSLGTTGCHAPLTTTTRSHSSPVKFDFPQISKLRWCFCLSLSPPPNMSDKCTPHSPPHSGHMAGEAHGLQIMWVPGSRTCRPRPSTRPCYATSRGGGGGSIKFPFPVYPALSGGAGVDNSIIAVNILFVIIPLSCLLSKHPPPSSFLILSVRWMGSEWENEWPGSGKQWSVLW